MYKNTTAAYAPVSNYIYQPVKIAGQLLVVGIALILSFILGVVRMAAGSVMYFTDKLQHWVNLIGEIVVWLQ